MVGVLSIMPNLANIQQQQQQGQQNNGAAAGGGGGGGGVGDEAGMDVEMWGDEFAAYPPTSKVGT